MRHYFFVVSLLLFSVAASANDQSDCTRAAGHYLIGKVVSNPVYTSGHFLHGVELSHTHLTIVSDANRKQYDVAIDNVFANGYQLNVKKIPAPLNTIHKGDKVELCGELYTQGLGIHWVHTNCGVRPSPNKPNGWVKKLNPDGSVSPNFEGLMTYCNLWSNQ